MKPLDVVALLEDRPTEHLNKGQVGTILEEVQPATFLVEFADLQGVPYAMSAIPADKLIELHHTAALAA